MTDGTFPSFLARCGNKNMIASQIDRSYLLLRSHILIIFANGTIRSRGRGRRSPSRYPARQRATNDFRRGLGPPRLSRIARAILPTEPSVVAGLLPDVKPCTSDCRAPQRRGVGAGAEARAWTVRRLLERAPVVERACLAGAVLFVPAGPSSFVEERCAMWN